MKNNNTDELIHLILYILGGVSMAILMCNYQRLL